ncbi:lipase maturation factor [Elysia marginata]|uniref:Lipase maturation factor n=1 Tax=Elysia marginata TaxID=1093978 RepID=A0AAV4F9M9_9GAST|nr:lipase maturation factor [Elysia marginata]
MGFIYFVAFLVSLNQNKQLLGKRGLLPADVYLSKLTEHIGANNKWSLLSAAPTVFWFVKYDRDLDFWLDVVAWVRKRRCCAFVLFALHMLSPKPY